MADHPLKQIQESVALRLSLKLWEKEELVLNRRIEQKETRRRNIQNEIYQLLGLYFVFLGVVLTAIFQAAAQPNPKTCKCWWSPFFLTAIALAVTLHGVHKKFHLQSEIQNQVEEEKEDSRALLQSIQQLRAEGIRFDINAHNPSTRGRQEQQTLRVVDWGYCVAVKLVENEEDLLRASTSRRKAEIEDGMLDLLKLFNMYDTKKGEDPKDVPTILWRLLQ